MNACKMNVANLKEKSHFVRDLRPPSLDVIFHLLPYQCCSTKRSFPDWLSKAAYFLYGRVEILCLDILIRVVMGYVLYEQNKIKPAHSFSFFAFISIAPFDSTMYDRIPRLNFR